jgi:prophage regulatory protein
MDQNDTTSKIARRLIRWPEVKKRTGLSRTTIWREVRAGRFPPPVSMSPSTSAWVDDEVDDAIEKRIAARDRRALARRGEEQHAGKGRVSKAF